MKSPDRLEPKDERVDPLVFERGQRTDEKTFVLCKVRHRFV